MIRIREIRAGILAIDELNIPPGISAVTGQNGAGKTTLLKLLAGIIRAKTGTITVDGADIETSRIGWVGEYPDRNILFTRVYDEIASPLRFSGECCADTESRVGMAASCLRISHLLSREIRGLSGGEKVLVSFATAIVTKPDILILDEYDSHMDDEFCRQIDRVLDRLGVRYIIFSTHRPERMAAADELILMGSGRVVNQYPVPKAPDADTLLADPKFWRQVHHYQMSAGW